MNEKIRKHINELFADAPKTRKALELKEEMIQNTIEKYQDLVSEGYQEEDAFQNVIHSIGDVSELFGDLEEERVLMLSETERKKKAMLTAAAAGLYIFAGVVFLICMVVSDVWYNMGYELGILGVALTALLCIPPTCMLVYASHMYPDYHKRSDNLVEIYKEAVHSNKKEKAVKMSISAIIWLSTLLVYFTVSFLTWQWYITWILFFVGGCAQAVLALVFSLRRNGV